MPWHVLTVLLALKERLVLFPEIVFVESAEKCMAGSWLACQGARLRKRTRMQAFRQHYTKIPAKNDDDDDDDDGGGSVGLNVCIYIRRKDTRPVPVHIFI